MSKKNEYPYVAAWCKLQGLSVEETALACQYAEDVGAPIDAVFLKRNAPPLYILIGELPTRTQELVRSFVPRQDEGLFTVCIRTVRDRGPKWLTVDGGFDTRSENACVFDGLFKATDLLLFSLCHSSRPILSIIIAPPPEEHST